MCILGENKILYSCDISIVKFIRKIFKSVIRKYKFIASPLAVF